MRQAIHIFRKDVRYLWREILILLFTLLALCFLEITHALRWTDLAVSPAPAVDLSSFLTPLAAWILIARVIHAEALPGDRQFWRTRPYEWKSLLGAKILFILAFVNAPVFLADILILLAYGFPPGFHLAGLFWSQLLLTVSLVLPMATLASVTVGLVQLILTILMSAATALAFMMLRHVGPGEYWGAFGWVQSGVSLAILAAVALVVVGLLYTRRTTTLARSLAAAGWVLVAFAGSLIPWTAAFALQSRFSKRTIDAASVQAGFDSTRTWMLHTMPLEGDRVEVTLPIQITGVPAGAEVKVEGIRFRIETQDGDSWSSRQPPPSAVTSKQAVVLLRDQVDAAFYRKVRAKQVHFRGSIYMTLLGDRRALKVPFGARASTPEAGICSAARGEKEEENFVLCRYPFRSPPSQTSIYFADYQAMTLREAISYSPFPASLRMSPVSVYFATAFRPPRPRYGSPNDPPLTAAEVVTTEPVAYFQRDFDIGGIRLADFETAAPRVRP